MKGDFTRGFNPDTKRGERYRRVLLQQGRALLDSDIAALVDATDASIRDAVRLTACAAGSPDLGFLVTPGVLLAQFDGVLGNQVDVAGAAVALRDYAQKYLDHLPGLRIGGAGGTVTVALAEPLAAPTAIRLWARADNGGANATLNGQAIALPAGPAFQPVDVTVSGADLQFSVDPAARYWIALVETRVEAGTVPALNWAGGTYEIDGLTLTARAAAWPAIADPAGGAYQAAAASPSGTRFIVYLEAHERHITAVDDPGILEEALGGDIDTTTRTEVTWQVKLAEVTSLGLAGIAGAFARTILPGGTATLGVANETIAPDPCDLPVPGGYTGPENRLYRLEVHGPAPAGGTLFKWSRENGSELFPAAFPEALVIGTNAASLVVQAEADLRDGDLVELLSDAIELGDETPGSLAAAGFTRPIRAQGRLLRLAGGEEVTGSTRVFDLLDPIDETPVNDVDSGRFGTAGLKLRRWSGLFVHDADAVHELEHGIQADIVGAFAAGDWWQYEARTGAANANGPVQGNPHGPERLFAPLAVISQTPAAQPMLLEAWLDRRFPRLCEIEADDVSYDGDKVGTDADTVQEALDELFERETGGCGEIPAPLDGDMRDIIDAIPNGGDAKICLGPGARAVPGEVIVENKGHITVTGIGLGSMLQSGRPLFTFRNCRAVTLVDFAIRADGNGANVIRIEDCAEVDLQRLTINTDGTGDHGIAAIRIESRSDGRVRRARVHQCQVRVGWNDTGLLALGVLDLAVTDCDIAVRESRFDLRGRMDDNSFASIVGRVFLSQLSFNVDTNIFVGGSDVEFDMNEPGRHGVALAGWGRDALRFSTHAAISSRTWERIAEANRPQASPSNRAHMRALVRRVRRGVARFSLGLDPGNATIPATARGILQQMGVSLTATANRLYGNAGIVVAAPRGPIRRISVNPSDAAADPLAQSVCINGNHVRGFHQGIRVGGSNASTGGPQNRVTLFGDVEVDANRIELLVPMYARSRWGIMVGSAVSVGVRNNRVLVDYRGPVDDIPNPLSPTDGIRVWGHFGLFVQIERNSCSFTTRGVRFRPLSAPNYPQTTVVWKVSDFINNEPVPTNAYTGIPGPAELVEIP